MSPLIFRASVVLSTNRRISWNFLLWSYYWFLLLSVIHKLNRSEQKRQFNLEKFSSNGISTLSSQEIKLDVASELIYSSDFESITFTGCGFCSHNISTGIKFDRNRRYSIRFYVRSFDISRGSFSVSLGGLKGGRWGPYQPGEKEFNVEYHPELLDPRDQVFSDSLIFYMSGNLNVVIDKIEIYQKEKE